LKAGTLKSIGHRDQFARVTSGAFSSESLAWNRRIAAAGGLFALIAAAIVGETPRGNSLAIAALVILATATALAFVELIRSGSWATESVSTQSERVKIRWCWIVAGLALAAAAIAQTWFRAGYSIAYGDNFPPDGVAGIARQFNSWSWSGSNLGGPAADERQLLSAPPFLIAHALGGGGPGGQRLLYTLLFVGVGLSALALLWSLGLSRFAASLGATYYLLNTFFLSGGVPTYTALATLALVPLLPALALAAGTGRVSLRAAIVAEAATAPLVGFVYLNPPSAGMAIAAFLASPLLAGWLFGRAAMRRAAISIGLGLGAILLVSAYWIVPSIIQLGNVGTAQLSSPSSWTWTEQRATIFNALWLNTNWGWRYSYYFPYSEQYQRAVLSLAKFAPAIVGFAALLIVGRAVAKGPRGKNHGALKVTSAFAAAAVVVIFLSTGTNWPGALVFNPLYSLPYGWLLREPGRFLLVSAVAYAVLISVSADAVRNSGLGKRLGSRFRLVTEWWVAAIKAAPSVALAAMTLLPGYPIVTGVFVPDRGLIAPAHVRLPAYWPGMANAIDSAPTSGPLLVLPPDDFYQMPYEWGYYGSDNFLPNLIHRHVINPSPGLGQGYTSASAGLLQASHGVADALLASDWTLAERLMQALGTRLVLVRRDIDASFPGRSILSPDRLADFLNRAPNFILLSTEGPLALFRLDSAAAPELEISRSFVTVNTDKPDLRILRYLPEGSHLISHPSQPGEMSVTYAPPITEWQHSNGALVYNATVPSDQSMKLVDLQRETQVSPQFQLTKRPSQAPGGQTDVTLRIAVSDNRLSNGDFRQGAWGSIDDCNAQSPATAAFGALVLPHGGPAGNPALELSASQDSACQSRAIDWTGRPLILELWVRHVGGSPPRLCVWQFGAKQCAATPDVPSSSTWIDYRAAITPDTGTTSLRLFLYAEGGPTKTTNEYAAVTVVEVASLGQPAIIATRSKGMANSEYLLTYHTSFSSAWHGSPGGTHVLVDGLVNGWIVKADVGRYTVSYSPEVVIAAGFLISALTSLLFLAFLLSAIRRLRKRHGIHSKKPPTWPGVSIVTPFDSDRTRLGSRSQPPGPDAGAGVG